MPFALVTVGMLLIISGFQNTYRELGRQVASDFSGPNNFFYWAVALGVIGALGYVKSLEGFSRAFMALVIVAIFLSNKGFFNQLNSGIQAGSSTPILPAGGTTSSGSGIPDNSGGSSILQDFEKGAKIGETIASFFGF